MDRFAGLRVRRRRVSRLGRPASAAPEQLRRASWAAGARQPVDASRGMGREEARERWREEQDRSARPVGEPRSLSKIDPRRCAAALGVGERERERGRAKRRWQGAFICDDRRNEPRGRIQKGLNAMSDYVLQRRQGGELNRQLPKLLRAGHARQRNQKRTKTGCEQPREHRGRTRPRTRAAAALEEPRRDRKKRGPGGPSHRLEVRVQRRSEGRNEPA